MGVRDNNKANMKEKLEKKEKQSFFPSFGEKLINGIRRKERNNSRTSSCNDNNNPNSSCYNIKSKQWR